MLILHGSWLVSKPTDKTRGFAVWAETDRAREMSTRPYPRAHPFAASARVLRHALLELIPSAKEMLKRGAVEFSATLWLPSPDEIPAASSPLLQLPKAIASTPPHLAAWQVESLRVEPHDAPALLALLPPEDDETPGTRLGADLNYWRAAGRFALELIARQRFTPRLLEEDRKFFARWQPLLDEANDAARAERLVKAMPPLCRALSRRQSDSVKAPSPRALLENFFEVVIDDFARDHADLRLEKKPYSAGATTTAEAWLDALNENSPIVNASDADLRAFFEQFRAWAEPFPGAEAGDTFRLCFRLEPPPTQDDMGIHIPKPNARDWTLRYLLQATDDPSLFVPTEQVWRARGSTLRFLNREFDAPQERMLAGLGHASRLFAPIETSLRKARPDHCALTANEAHTFIREIALLLQSFGFGVLVPGLNSKLGVRVRLKSAPRPSPQGGVAGLTFESLVQYDWQLALGEAVLSREEFEKLAALKTPLVQIRGQWVELRPEQLEQAIKFWETRKGAGELTTQDAMRLALTLAPTKDRAGLPVTEVAAQGWIGELLDELQRGEKSREPLAPPREFVGTLRHYQIAGLSWLAFLRQWGLGACLADDMGLGKTIEVAALLLHERAQQNGDARPTLVICPTSVVTNWQRELERFAPSLRVHIYHGAARKKKALEDNAAQHDVVISSYALLPRDEKEFAQVEWDNVILDEAQNIKNPTTKQAQAARHLRATWRAALTGTPVENRLTELWSIFQFLNPGYLGSQEAFRRELANPIERAGDPDATKQLKSLVSPFILRRLKSDPAVIGDLPQKNEMKVYCNLTREQATLYEAIVRDSMQRIEASEGIERRGMVLATLMKLKQVCNHPAQFLGDGSALAGRSGKLARLTEMLDEVRAVRERALVFTQFAEMGKLLQSYLQAMLADEVLFLHGGTPAHARPALIDRFQNDAHGPLVFILSLKAGGTGLNLMRANHVFHFDRWWNPAVENQATDRAFRIGQTKNVQVYKYLCAGTFEEKIDEMIERKQALAQRIVGASEQWITELSTAQLRDLFALRREAIGD